MTSKIVVIFGPTGIGKTAFAIHLARIFNGEIISADSMQVYKYMDIGTAKPTQDEQRLIPHHLIDIVSPDEDFQAALYAKLAHQKIHELLNQQKIPFVVGGTGLYIKALLHGLFSIEPVNPEIIHRLKMVKETYGNTYLYEQLLQVDPESAKRIHFNDYIRIIRALSVFESQGIPISELQKAHAFQDTNYQTLKMGLCMDRDMLYQRINERVNKMINMGLIDEVKRLIEQGYDPKFKSMQSIGYRHIIQFLKGELTWEDTLNTFMQDTRHYAKRQFTWFKKEAEVHWMQPDLNHAQHLIHLFLQGNSLINKK
ncbi:MAG: tRNA (adenosine(37)-N6)-dimethylallyltransferase MiaA [Desulfobacterales bacterium]|nr:tRNA (adenosine(37)-N6)-dimethylallyltransferase MiaA [Desulfobacterales bacterium]